MDGLPVFTKFIFTLMIFNDSFFSLILILISSRLWCRLGLNRPDGFVISFADWVRHNVRLSSDTISPNGRLRRKIKSWMDGVLLVYEGMGEVEIYFWISSMDKVHRLCRSLGLDGPDDFGISIADWARHDVRSSSDTILPNGRLRRQIKSWTHGVLLGKGSYGMVYEGMSEEGFFFAVKEVSLLDQGTNAQQCIFQLEQEIALLSQFEHENIVQYYGTDTEDTKLFIFLELVTQGSLASLYQKYSLQDSQVSAYTRQILNGLKYLHDRNVVHRDIKCANILVHANGSVKLADFGLAKEMTKINMLKSCKGSIYWMAPEVVNPRRSYGPAADIWSLGCTVLEMLTHQIPYPNLEWAQALFRIGRGEPPTIPISLSKNARDFISLCVKVNPEDRPTASELLQHPFVMRSRVSPGSNSSPFSNER